MLPYIEVTNLAPSASFYSAITHPLGLRYISANPGAIVYGAPSPSDPKTNDPVFEVRSVGDRAEPRKHARLVLSASSPSVVQDFHAAALRAYPDLPLIGGAGDSSHRHSDTDPASGDNRAQAHDLDGNIMEVVYVPPTGYPSDHAGSTVRRTQSSTHEVSRIMDWNLDVATSQPSKSIAAGPAGGARTTVSRRTGSGAGEDDPPYILRRSVTTSIIETGPSQPSPRETSNGLSTGTLVGSILGAVAAGAAIGGAMTYMNMKKEREQAPRQDFEPPAFQRRATEPFPDPRPRYMERTVEKVYYEDQLPPTNGRYYPPPTYMAKYSQAGGRSREAEELDDGSSRHTARQSTSGKSRARSAAGSARQPLMIAESEYRSNAGSKYTTAPKLLMDSEHRSHAGSRHPDLMAEADLFSRAPSKHSTPRSARHQEPEAATYISSRSKHEPRPDSYVSARSSKHRPPEAETYISSRSKSHAPETYVSSRSKRSERSESTMKPTKKSVAYDTPRSVIYGDMPVRSAAPSKSPSKAPSKAPTRHTAARSSATARLIPVARHYPLPESHASYASAREVPLPASRASWDDDGIDDNDSIAPSDSISCIGTRSRSGRAYN